MADTNHEKVEDKSNSTPGKKAEKPEKPPVDNVTLAAMLRKSATIVEKGEFDVILYHALQDFRTYYKQKLPRKKEKGEKKKKTKIISTTTTHIPADSSAKTANISSGGPTKASAADETTPSVQESGPDTVDSNIRPNSARLGADGTDKQTLDEGYANETSGRSAQDSQASPVGGEEGAAKINAGMFGSFKLPKLHVHLPNHGKKHATEISKAEMDGLTGGSTAQQAESTRRRRGLEDTGPEMEWRGSGITTGLSQSSSTNNLENVAAAEDEVSSGGLQARAVAGVVPGKEKNSREPTKPIDENEKNAAMMSPPPATTAGTTTSNVPLSNIQTFEESFSNENQDGSIPETGIPAFGYPGDMDNAKVKPAFQRPTNSNSPLVANGWVEQLRRSKMRTVWKEVLASLVLGKRPGEETTLWIQREVVNPVTGNKELEALHQIPVKLLESVALLDYTIDNRFTLKTYNSQEEFVFRCDSDPSAATNWVITLQEYEKEAKGNKTNFDFARPQNGFDSVDEEKKGQDVPMHAGAQSDTSRLAIRDLRAICHGAGINTVGMERPELEAAAKEVQSRGTYFPHPNATNPKSVPPQTSGYVSPPRSASPTPPVANISPNNQNDGGGKKQKLGIKDLRAICHGAGISTVGMERGELEAAAEQVLKRGTYFERPTSTAGPPQDGEFNRDESARMRAEEDTRRRRQAEEEGLRRREEEQKRREEELRKREEEHRRREEEHRRREEEHRRRIAEEEHRRRMAAEEEHRRRVAEQQAAEQRRRYAEQQAAWQQQQQQEEQRRRMAEQQAAEQRRRHEEAMRKQQQWANQSQQQQQQQWTRHPPHQGHQPQQQQQWSQKQQQQQQQTWNQQQQQQQWHQQQQTRPQAPPPQQPRPQAPPPQQQQNASAASAKYAKMANQTNDGQAMETKIKHGILIQWALQPPQMQMLRSIDVLISSIQNIFPPALGVPAHDYFGKWKPVARKDVTGDSGMPDEDKLKKAVKRLRFFLREFNLFLLFFFFFFNNSLTSNSKH